ncbi:hypothetical protein HMPREF1142_1031 [Peptostreptococcaceae bacterium AS15]|nr:hypothetical protein HMPREF0379_1632 [[Eubacterium] yurii subsp. margaretiae ATCC 43715]EJP23130.1 hypothetical protein HMPREF1142_1031 [Peptostreptococcaceae bacterium AS15]
MNNTVKLVEEFFQKSLSLDDFWDADALTWVDWREYDEDIIDYVNEKIGSLISVSHHDNGKDYGDDIIISYKGRSFMIPYGDVMDRDTTIIYVNELIKPDFEIRLFIENLGSDTLGFVILDRASWERFEKEYNADVSRYFMPINKKSRIFELSLREVEEYLKLSKDNPDTPSNIILEIMDLNIEKDKVWEQRQNGEIDLKSYVSKKKELEEQINVIVEKYGIR